MQEPQEPTSLKESPRVVILEGPLWFNREVSKIGDRDMLEAIRSTWPDADNGWKKPYGRFRVRIDRLE